MAKKDFTFSFDVNVNLNGGDENKGNGKYTLFLTLKASSHKNAADKLETALQRLIDSMESKIAKTIDR